jgi:hypothetical protein
MMKPRQAVILIIERTNSTDVRSQQLDSEQKLVSEQTFAVSSHTKDLDDNQDRKEDRNPDANVNIISPELDGDARGSNLERQSGEPANGIIPSNSKTTRL